MQSPTHNSGPIYLNISEIFPAQLRKSSQHVQEKIAKKIAKCDVRWNSKQVRWEYFYDSGRSIFSIKEALPVVKAPFGYVLTDGHHDVLSSLALEATRIPVNVITDLSALSENEFWNMAENLGFAYLYDLHGIRKIPFKEFQLLEDDPNRYFAAISARKYLNRENTKNSLGAEYPLWIKIGKGIPFIEFKIADILWQNQIIYHYGMGKNPPIEFTEAARQALVVAKIPNLHIIEQRKHFSELSLS